MKLWPDKPVEFMENRTGYPFSKQQKRVHGYPEKQV